MRKRHRRAPPVAVVGLGHVGLPLAVLLHERQPVVGLDSDRQRVRSILAGEPGIHEPGLRRALRRALRSGKLNVTSDPQEILRCRVKIVTVGTPYDRVSRRSDLSQLRSAVRAVAENLRPRDVIVLRSTVAPGTTLGEVAQTIRARRLRVPEDVGLAFSPERIIQGQALKDLRTLPKVIGATDDRSFRAAASILSQVGAAVVRVRDPTVAELVKLVDNYARYAFIAVVNELALIVPRFGASVHEVIEAARESYPRNSGLLAPGPGVGGSCLTKDPFLLSDLARNLGAPVHVVRAARVVNDSMPGKVIELTRAAAGRRRTVVIAGVAYKGNTDDTRFTPAELVARGLQRQGFTLRFADPLVRSWSLGPVGPSIYSEARGSGVVVLLADHDHFRALNLRQLASVMQARPVLVDARNLISPAAAHSAGFRLVKLGGP